MCHYICTMTTLAGTKKLRTSRSRVDQIRVYCILKGGEGTKKAASGLRLFSRSYINHMCSFIGEGLI